MYLDSAAVPATLKKADALTVGKAAVVGVALNKAAAGQPLTYATSGVLTTDAVWTAGQVYALDHDASSGDFALESDIVSPQIMTILGWGLTTTTLQLNIIKTGVIHA